MMNVFMYLWIFITLWLTWGEAIGQRGPQLTDHSWLWTCESINHVDTIHKFLKPEPIKGFEEAASGWVAQGVFEKKKEDVLFSIVCGLKKKNISPDLCTLAHICFGYVLFLLNLKEEKGNKQRYQSRSPLSISWGSHGFQGVPDALLWFWTIFFFCLNCESESSFDRRYLIFSVFEQTFKLYMIVLPEMWKWK